MPTFRGKVAVVTGATSGIGRWVAQGLAALGATTVVVGRSPARAAALAGEISAQTENREVYPVSVADLAIRAEVARLSSVLLEQYPRIDLLVNNAGAYFHRREVSPEGIERTFALNVLAPFLLTSLLTPRLVASAPSRVIMVSSAAHYRQNLDFENLQGERNFRGYRAYGRSKLGLTLLTREFARRLHDSEVMVNAVHPGFVASGFGRNNGGAVGFGFALVERLFARNVRSAAADVVFVGTDPSLDRVTGEYLSRRIVRPGSPQSRDMAAAARLYQTCAELGKPFL